MQSLQKCPLHSVLSTSTDSASAMRPPNNIELEVLLLLEVYLGCMLAALVPLGPKYARLAFSIADSTRLQWQQWKESNDPGFQYVDLITEEYKNSFI